MVANLCQVNYLELSTGPTAEGGFGDDGYVGNVRGRGLSGWLPSLALQNLGGWATTRLGVRIGE
jgi:hypothetical protein